VTSVPKPWLRSLPTTAAVRRLVEDHYPLRPVDVALVRSFTNDVYRIDTADRSYALKLYGAGRFTAEEIRWEQQFADHLVADDLLVPVPVRLSNNDQVGVLDAPEGQRLFAMVDWLPGHKPEPPWTDGLYRDVGAALAQFHVSADNFTTGHPRSPVRTGDEPAELLAALSADPERQQLVGHAADAAHQEIDRLAAEGLHWGIRHGDPSLDNLHLSDRGIQFYDFDLAGPGWQVEDLSGALSTDFGDVFLAGYTAVRPLPAVELEALPWLKILATIDNLHFHVIIKPRTHGTDSLSEGWVDGGFAALTQQMRAVGLRG
jgi:Ser/Thr protein kinase RdoA (MazF antagonist)